MSKLKKGYKVLVIIFLFVIFSNTILGASYIYNVNKEKNNLNKTQNVDNVENNSIKSTKEESSVSTLASSPEFNFKSQSQILMEPESGTVIYENNADEKLLPASVTKVMTLLLIMEQIDSR